MAQKTYIARKGEDADFANVTVSGTLAVTGATSLTVDLAVIDDQDIQLGTGTDTLIRFSTGDASNHATVVGLDNTSQQIHITDKAAVATDWARSAGTHPELAIHSNTTPATDYLAIGNHDGTTATLDVVGGTTLNLDIAGSNAFALTATAGTFDAGIVIGGGTGTQNPLDMDSITSYATAGATGTLGNVVKQNLSGSVTHTATTAGLVVKNYTDGQTINGNYELSGSITYLKNKATQSGGAKSSLASFHRHSSSTTNVDYGLRVFAANSTLTTFIYASGTMTNFFEAVADGAGGATLGSDGMNKSPNSETEDGYLTIIVGGTSYEIPFYEAA